jgi:hypothetical protein
MIGPRMIGPTVRRVSAMPVLFTLLVAVSVVLLAAPADAAVGAPAQNAPAVALAAESHRAAPPAFWLTLAGIAALIVAAAVALGPHGDPQPPRQGSVLKFLERRSHPNASPEDSP